MSSTSLPSPSNASTSQVDLYSRRAPYFNASRPESSVQGGSFYNKLVQKLDPCNFFKLKIDPRQALVMKIVKVVSTIVFAPLLIPLALLTHTLIGGYSIIKKGVNEIRGVLVKPKEAPNSAAYKESEFALKKFPFPESNRAPSNPAKPNEFPDDVDMDSLPTPKINKTKESGGSDDDSNDRLLNFFSKNRESDPSINGPTPPPSTLRQHSASAAYANKDDESSTASLSPLGLAQARNLGNGFDGDLEIPPEPHTPISNSDANSSIVPSTTPPRAKEDENLDALLDSLLDSHKKPVSPNDSSPNGNPEEGAVSSSGSPKKINTTRASTPTKGSSKSPENKKKNSGSKKGTPTTK